MQTLSDHAISIRTYNAYHMDACIHVYMDKLIEPLPKTTNQITLFLYHLLPKIADNVPKHTMKQVTLIRTIHLNLCWKKITNENEKVMSWQPYS